MKNLELAGLFSYLLIAQNIPISSDGFAEVASKFGLPVAGLIFFTWWSWKREGKLSERIQQVEDDRVKLLKETIEANTAAMNRMAEASAQCPANKLPKP